jgi:hypothetical protein
MPYFIMTSGRTAVTKYIVMAESAEAADIGNGEYIGYVDQDDDQPIETFGPFESKEEAEADTNAYTQGR